MTLRITLTTNPQTGSFQAKFEEIMRLIGRARGALAVSACGGYYVSEDVQRHWDAFLQNTLG